MRNHPSDLDAIHRQAGLCWSQAREAAAAGRYREAFPLWEQGLECYRQLYSRSDYWDKLREEERALCGGFDVFDETRFEERRRSALAQLVWPFMIGVIHDILMQPAREGGIEAGTRLMAIIDDSNLPDRFKQQLSDELARRLLYPEATQVPERDLEELITRARRLIDIDKKSVAARQFVIKAVAHFVKSNAGADDQIIRKCTNLLQAQKVHAEWLRANRQGLADQHESVERNLAAYYHGLGACVHALGQSEVRAGNRCFLEAKQLRARLDEAQGLGQDYVSVHLTELLATQDRHNSLFRQAQQHLDALKRYYQESDEALRRVLELDPINFEAKRLMDSHREEYGKLGMPFSSSDDEKPPLATRGRPPSEKTPRARRSAIVPGTRADRVHFSVVSPSSVKPASGFVVDFYAHLAKHQAEVQRRAKQDADGENIRIKEKGPVEVARGTVLTARLEVQGFVVDDPVDTILWEGDIGNATFFVQVPDDVPPGTRRGLIEVSATGVRIARIDFMVRIGGAATRPDVQRARETRCRAAFASYSRQDTDDVLKMVQMVRLAMPYLEIYMDKTSLRPGQGLHWETELYRMIMGSDVFYLFWSQNAKASAWVEKEWRYALSNRGLDFIAPVPLISPEVAAPPPELEALHFDDLHLRLRR